MNRADRKAAIETYRQRPSVPGIYALRCLPGAQVWVGRAPDLATIRNRVLFVLRQGSSPHRALQAAWTVHGEAGFAFEVLEELDPEALGLGLERELKARHKAWVERLGAKAI